LIAAAFAAGVWLASQFALPLWLSGSVALLSAAVAVVMRRSRATSEPVWVAVLVALFAMGAVRYTLSAPVPAANSIARYNGQRVVLEGIVAAEPDVRPEITYLRVQPTRVLADGAFDDDIADLALVRIAREMTLTARYGDAIRVDGWLDAPPQMSTFDYRDYLARRGVFSWMPRPERAWVIGEGYGSLFFAGLLQFKDRVRQTVKRILPMPESALLNGILIGDDNDIPDDLKEAFRRTGTSHIVAISGFNVSIVIALVVPLLARLLNPRRAALFALPAIALYTIFVGASASVVRASVMAAIGLIGLLFWRRGFTLNTLCLAALIMLLADPNTLFDVGFQLSFMATLGLVLYADRFSRRTRAYVQARVSDERAQRLTMLALDGVLVTLAAQITTLPLILTTYGQLSLVSLLANALVLPLQPPIMILGAAAAAVGLISLPLGSIAGLPAYGFLTATIHVIEWLSTPGFAAVAVFGFGTAAALAYYLALVLLGWVLMQSARTRSAAATALRSRAVGIAGALALLIPLTLGMVYWFQRPDGRLHVTFSGGSAFIQTPSGKQVVYSGGGNIAPLTSGGMPVWDQEVDVLILPRRDDFARRDALPLLQRYRIGLLVTPGGKDEPSAALAEWSAVAQVNALRTMTVTTGVRIELEPGVTLAFDTGRTNRGAQQIAAWVQHGANRIVLAGEAGIPDEIAGSDIVFVSADGVSADRLNALQPRWVIWTDASGGDMSHNLNRGIRAIALRNVQNVTFIGDGQNVTMR
jgi:competence protein ComEC